MRHRRFDAGDVAITVINLGDLRFRLRDVERSPESEWRPRYGELFERSLLFPSQSFLVATPEASILVDAGDYALFAAADRSYVPENYTPPPGLVEQLAELGVTRERITHVIITHAHYDHYAGITTESGGRFSPTFPRARVVLGGADIEDPEMQRALGEPTSPQSITLGVVRSHGLLELAEGEGHPAPSVTTIASPGESPGHRIVRVSSGGKTFYIVGDLFHHAVEVEDENLMAQWCDALANKKSRASLIRAALSEDAVVLAAHMPPGRIGGSTESPKFIPV